MDYFLDEKELDNFTFGAITSTSFNLIITECDNLRSFENDFELIEVPGRSGDLIVSNNRKKNKDINVEGYIDCEDLGDAKAIVRNVNNWLIGETRYKPLTFSNDLVSYEAIVVGNVEMIEEMKDLINIKFKFSAKEVI